MLVKKAPVTELAYVLDLGSRFWEFKSPRGYLNGLVAQLDRASHF